MRLGGPIFSKHVSPDEWAHAVTAAGYRAAYCPLAATDDHTDATINAYKQAAADADIVIAEVGAWSNPISLDEEMRKAGLDKCKRALALADQIGARCTVNVVGSLRARKQGLSAEDLSDETFARIVDSVREIIDAVKPTRSVYALEMLPWLYPDSPDSYLRLIRAIDRPRGLGVHLDPVNIITSPTLYFNNARLLRECFAKLGPMIRSCHAKDILMQPKLTVHLDEVQPGTGNLDYRVFLRELDNLSPDIPLMLEHLSTEGEYQAAAIYIRQVAKHNNPITV